MELSSPLGRYIQQNAKMYYKYGTRNPEKSSEIDYTVKDAYLKQKEQNNDLINRLPSIDKRVLNKLRKRVFHEKKKNRVDYIKEEGINQDILNILTKRIEDSFEGDRNNNIKKLLKDNFNLDNVNIEEARKARRNFLIHVNTINKAFEKGERAKESTIKALNNNLDRFFNNIGLAIDKIDTNDIEAFNFLKAKENIKKGIEKEQLDTLTALRNTMTLINLSQTYKASRNGIYGESLVNAVSDGVINFSKNELQKTLTKALETGEERSSFQLPENTISSDVRKNIENKYGTSLFQIHHSQNKVDANITILNHPLKVSVKAYTPSGNTIRAHLQDVRLIYSLATTERDFANHWLNRKILKIKGKYTDNLNYELKRHMMYEALVSGNMLKRDASNADTFVAIDMEKGRVYAESTKDILKDNIDKFSFSPDTDYISININNIENTSYDDREYLAIAAIHGEQIGVTYRAKLA